MSYTVNVIKNGKEFVSTGFKFAKKKTATEWAEAWKKEVPADDVEIVPYKKSSVSLWRK